MCGRNGEIVDHLLLYCDFVQKELQQKKKMFDSLVESFLVAEHIEAYLALIEILEQNL